MSEPRHEEETQYPMAETPAQAATEAVAPEDVTVEEAVTPQNEDSPSTQEPAHAPHAEEPAQVSISVANTASEPQPPASPSDLAPAPAEHIVTIPESSLAVETPPAKDSEKTKPATLDVRMVSAPADSKTSLGSTGVEGIQSTMESRTQMRYKGNIVETYIPLRYTDVDDILFSKHPEFFQAPDAKEKFRKLQKLIAMSNKMRLALHYMDFRKLYSDVDPDADCEFDQDCSTTASNAINVFKKDMTKVLDACEFDIVDDEVWKKAYDETSITGLECKKHVKGKLDIDIHFRGVRRRPYTIRRWRNFFRKEEIMVQYFQRMLMIFRPNPNHSDKKFLGFFSKFFNKDKNKLSPNFMYLKMFKDINIQDLDLMYPGSEVEFQWYDFVLLWGPFLFGVAFGLYKIIAGTLNFDTPSNVSTSLVLVVGPFMVALKAYFGMVNKENCYRAHLGQLYMLHNLTNNAAVISTLLDEAEEQDDNEMLLAYTFLWQGKAQPVPISEGHLDNMVEKFVKKIVDEAAEKEKTPLKDKDGNPLLQVDFEVDDALNKLMERNIVTCSLGADGKTKMYQAVDIDTAMELLLPKHMKIDLDDTDPATGIRSRSSLNSIKG